MGILGRFIFDAALKVAIESGAAGKAIDTISPKLNKATKTMTNDEATRDSSFVYHLIVENEGNRDSCDWNNYDIFDTNDNRKYVVTRPSSNWKYEIHIFNSENKKIGVITEFKPFLKKVYEQKERTCDIELNGKRIGRVNRYDTSIESSISFNYKGFRVRKNIFNTKTEITKNKKVMCRINHQFATTDSRGKYVISYNDKEFEEAFVLFTIAMDKIDSSDY